MSQENVEAFKRGLEAGNRGDVDGLLKELDPEVEWHSALHAFLGGEQTVFRGHDGVREMLRDLNEAFGEIHIEISEIRDLGNRLVAIGRNRARGRGSGAETKTPLALVTEIKNGKTVSVRGYLDPKQALEAVGLAELDAHARAMSQENLIQAVYKAWSEDDLDALLETLDPDVVLLTSGSFPDLDPAYRGHDGIRTFWDAMRAPWGWFRLDVERIVEGKDRAAFVLRFRARGQGSGVMTDLRQGHAAWFKNGRVVKLSTHTSFQEALEAVGLSGQDAHAGP